MPIRCQPIGLCAGKQSEIMRLDFYSRFFLMGRESGEKRKCLSTQLCLTLCDSMDGSLPGSSVHGILQARILEWIAIPFSRDLPNMGIKLGSHTLQADS